MDEKKALAEIERWEGRVPHLYLDSRGNPTIGLGCLIKDFEAYRALPLRVKDRLATKFEAQDDWTRVTNMPIGRRSSAYKADPPAPDVRLTDADIDELAMHRLSAFVRNLRSAFPGFDDAPAPAQVATIDLVWCLGFHKLLQSFPRFCVAFRRRDWPAAARESYVTGARETRNLWRAQLFLDAAVYS